MATTALSPMDVKAAGKGNQTKSTTAISVATLTTMVSQIQLSKATQNHTAHTAPITRQPTRYNDTKYPVSLPLPRTRPRTSSRSRPRPTSVTPIPNSGKTRGSNSKPATGKIKGSYTWREAKVHNTISPSAVAGTTDKSKTHHRAPRNKKTSIRNGKWSYTSHSLNTYDWREDWELSSTFISQTEEPLESTISATVEPTPSALVQSTPTVSPSLEPTPSSPQEATVSWSPEPTLPLREPTLAPILEKGTPTPKPTCPPRAERPTPKFIRGDNQGNIYVKLDNSPEFIEACQPLVYRARWVEQAWMNGEYRVIAANLSADNPEFQTATERHSHHMGSQNTRDGAVFNIRFNTVAICRNNPSLNWLTSWSITQSFDPDADQGKLVYEHTDQIFQGYALFFFEYWYYRHGKYHSLPCADKYGKMQLEPIIPRPGQCPVTVTNGKRVYVRIAAFPVFVNENCFPGNLPIDLGPHLQLNGQRTAGLGVGSMSRHYIRFALNCQGLQSYDIWKHGFLNFTLSRPTTRPGGEPDQASITIPIQKLPGVTGVQLDRDNRRLTIQFQEEPSWCLAIVITTAPFPAFEQDVNGTANNTDASSTDGGQVFLCLNPDRRLSIPLADPGPEQSDVVLISLMPVWDIEEDFSLENPRDKDRLQGAEHLVAYPGEQPPWDDRHTDQDNPRPDAPFTIKPCTGHCQTHLLPTILANISNVTTGQCPWIADPTTAPTRPAHPTLPGSVPVSITSPFPSSDRDSPELERPWYANSANVALVSAVSGAGVLAPCVIVACCGISGYLLCKNRQGDSLPTNPPTDVEHEKRSWKATSDR